MEASMQKSNLDNYRDIVESFDIAMLVTRRGSEIRSRSMAIADSLPDKDESSEEPQPVPPDKPPGEPVKEPPKPGPRPDKPKKIVKCVSERDHAQTLVSQE
jgi:hypothetical protein